MRQGEEGDRFYMITRGEAVVKEKRRLYDGHDGHHHDHDHNPRLHAMEEERELTRLYEGHVFGEMSLIYKEPRTASVIAVGSVKCLYLVKEDFESCLLSDRFQRVIQQAYIEKATRRAMRTKNEQQQQQQAAAAALKKTQSVVTKARNDDDRTRQGRMQTENDVIVMKKQGKEREKEAPVVVAAAETHTLKKHRLASGEKVINSKYVIKNELGKGAFGTVKLCLNHDDQKLYAVKIMVKSFIARMATREDSLQDALRREVAIMKKLNHKNIVRLIEVIDDPSCLKVYLVQEYVEKGMPVVRHHREIDSETFDLYRA